MSQEYKYVGPKTVDVSSTGPVTDMEMNIKGVTRTALRVDAGGDSPQIGIQVSPNGNNWYVVGKNTGQDFDILRNIPEAYVRPNVITADSTDTGTAEVTLVASPQ